MGSEGLQFADVHSSERRVSKTVKEGDRETWGLAKEPIWSVRRETERVLPVGLVHYLGIVGLCGRCHYTTSLYVLHHYI